MADVDIPIRPNTTEKGEMSAEDRWALINENLAEVLNPEIIKKIVDEGGHPKIYWGE